MMANNNKFGKQGWTPERLGSLKGKVYVITGANGAIAQVPKQEFTVDGFESQLGVNHYGHFTLQGMLFPLIEKSKGRIVVVGSEGYKMGIKTIQFDDMNWDKNE